MTDLLDVNVWLALADARHVHHSRALHYWENEAASLTVFCRVTMLGFLRLITQSRMANPPLTSARAWEVYRAYLQASGVGFLQEPVGLDEKLAAFSTQPTFRHRHWTDAYLAALAIAAGCRLVSFDSDFQAFEGLHFLRLTPPYSTV
jgi:toxin-antitoxin system PIN domain toxin